ncbi:MAG: phosphatidate cytidylyltransferase [bacterium]
MSSDLLGNEIFKRTSVGLILGLCFLGAYIHSQLLFLFILLFLLIEILVFEWPKLVTFNNLTRPFGRTIILLMIFFTIIYPILPIFSLFYLHWMFYAQDFLLPLYPFLVAWSGDTGAFIVGKLIGKHKIVPSISPKKSWEGLLGGFIATFVFNFFYLPGIKISPFPKIVHKFWLLVLFSAVITVVGFFGDIFVSFLKRKKNLKDTGNLLPGHGGFLDRFDSVLFIAVFVLVLILVV